MDENENNKSTSPPKKIGEIVDLDRFKRPSSVERKSEETPDDGLNPDTMYYRVFVGVASHFGLKTTETNVLSVIYSLQQKYGWCYAGQETIARAARVSVQTLNTLLKKLRAKGLLEKGERSRYDTIKWRLGAEALDRMKYVEDQIKKIRDSTQKRQSGY